MSSGPPPALRPQPLESRKRSASVGLASSTAAMLSFLDALPEAIAEARLPGGWTPAGHAWHVALTNDVFIGAIDGTGPIPAVAGVSKFDDTQWDFNAPPRVAAPGLIVPPDGVRRDAARAKLAESAKRLAAAIDTIGPAQATLCVQLPWAIVSLMQMSEWGAGHTLRHLAQIGRELHVAGLRSGH